MCFMAVYVFKRVIFFSCGCCRWAVGQGDWQHAGPAAGTVGIHREDGNGGGGVAAGQPDYWSQETSLPGQPKTSMSKYSSIPWKRFLRGKRKYMSFILNFIAWCWTNLSWRVGSTSSFPAGVRGPRCETQPSDNDQSEKRQLSKLLRRIFSAFSYR